MKIRHATDLHLEFFKNPNYRELANQLIPEMEDDFNSVLILSGDVSSCSRKNTVAQKIFDFLEELSGRFQKVFWVFGNHEFYQGNIDREVSKSKEVVAPLGNVHILDNEKFIINDIAFVGTTLWSDISGVLTYQMNDTKKIHQKSGSRYFKVTRQRLQNEFFKNKLFLKEELKKLEENELIKKIVLITHHSPSYKSVEKRDGVEIDDVSKAYASDLENIIINFEKIKLIFHGHTHQKEDFYIGGIRVFSNPHGYIVEPEEQDEYDKYFTISLD